MAGGGVEVFMPLEGLVEFRNDLFSVQHLENFNQHHVWDKLLCVEVVLTDSRRNVSIDLLLGSAWSSLTLNENIQLKICRLSWLKLSKMVSLKKTMAGRKNLCSDYKTSGSDNQIVVRFTLHILWLWILQLFSVQTTQLTGDGSNMWHNPQPEETLSSPSSYWLWYIYRWMIANWPLNWEFLSLSCKVCQWVEGLAEVMISGQGEIRNRRANVKLNVVTDRVL